MKFGANEIPKDTQETKEDQLVLLTAHQKEQHVILPTTAHHQDKL